MSNLFIPVIMSIRQCVFPEDTISKLFHDAFYNCLGHEYGIIGQ